MSKLIWRFDPSKTVQVLLHHCLSVDGRLVCFNIHPNFSDFLEGLIIVDARKTLRRFLVAEGSELLMTFNKS